jgi:hypothetical protein
MFYPNIGPRQAEEKEDNPTEQLRMEGKIVRMRSRGATHLAVTGVST